MQVKVDVQVAFAVELAEIGLAGCVAEEPRPRSGNRLLEFGFVGFFLLFPAVGRFAAEVVRVEPGRGDHLLPNVGRIADHDVEAAAVALKDFHKGDVPNKGDVLRAAERRERVGDAGEFGVLLLAFGAELRNAALVCSPIGGNVYSRQRILLLGRRFDLSGERGDLVLQRVLFVVKDGTEEIDLFLFEVGFAQVLLALVKAEFFAFELGDTTFELGRDGEMRPVQAEVDAADLLHEAIAAAYFEREIGQQRAELQFGRRQLGFDDQLQPEAQFGDVDGPVHHVYAVQLLADDAAAAFVGCFINAELGIGAGLEVVEHEQHPDEERAGATGGVADGGFAQHAVEVGPQVLFGECGVGGLFLGGLIRKDGVVEQRFFVRAEPIGESVHERKAAHQVNFDPCGVENPGRTAPVVIGDPLERDVDQRLVDLADHFGVNGNFDVERRRFGDGEVVAFEKAGSAAVELVEERGKERIGYRHTVGIVEPIAGEESAVEIWRKLERLVNRSGKLPMAAVEGVVERLEEQYREPALEEAVVGLVGSLVCAPELGDEPWVAAEPAFALDEVEEHQPVEQLQRVIVRPDLIAGGVEEQPLQGGKDLFVIGKEPPGDRFDIKCAVEFVGEGGDGRLAMGQLVEGECQFGETFNGGARRRSDVVGERAQFDLAVGSLTRPCEGKLAGVLGDVAEHMLGMHRLECALDGAAGGDARQPIPRPDDAIDRQARKPGNGLERDALVDGRAEIERARQQAARRAPVERLAEEFAEFLW